MTGRKAGRSGGRLRGRQKGERGPRDYGTTDDEPEGAKAEMLVRSEKTCVSGGESPSGLEARLPRFGTRVTNGKV